MLIVEKTEDFFKKLKLPKIQPLPQNTNFFIFIYTLPDDFPWRYIYIYMYIILQKWDSILDVLEIILT